MDTSKHVQADSGSHAVTLKELGIKEPKKVASAKQFSIWVHSLLQNWRQGMLGVKERSDVSFSTKKPWKQKGTGRARAGSRRSPLWRSGGVTFGPQKRVRTLSVPKTMKRQILLQLLVDRLANKKVVVADWELKNDRPKTAEAAKLLKKLSLHDKKVTVLLSSEDLLTFGSFVNIPGVQVLLFDQPNAYDLANCEYWLLFKRDLDAFKEMTRRWQ